MNRSCAAPWGIGPERNPTSCFLGQLHQIQTHVLSIGIAIDFNRFIMRYRDHYVGEGYPDLVVHFGKRKVVVELKAVASELGASEERQLRNYRRILGVEQGLLINFQSPGKKQGKTRLEIRQFAL
jgi:GxxExxY protein